MTSETSPNCSPSACGRRGSTSAAPMTARGALGAVSEAKPELIILDVTMPDIDGGEVVRRMRADNRWIPVIFLTARDATDDKRLRSRRFVRAPTRESTSSTPRRGYGFGASERLPATVLRGRPRDQVVIATKGGLRPRPGANRSSIAVARSCGFQLVGTITTKREGKRSSSTRSRRAITPTLDLTRRLDHLDPRPALTNALPSQASP